MSTAIPQIQIRVTTRVPAKLRLHSILILICALSLVALALALASYGYKYYLLDAAHRPLSPMHSFLKPSGEIGLRLGISGFVLFALLYLYPLRKRWAFLGRIGKTGHWLDYHVLMGLAAPVLITFHTSLKFQGFAGITYWTMIALVVSGFVGRYPHAQIPQALETAIISLREMRNLQEHLVRQLTMRNILPADELERCLLLPEVEVADKMPLIFVPFLMLRNALVLTARIWSLRRQAAGNRAAYLSLGVVLPARNPQLEEAVKAARKQAALARRILFLSRVQRVFRFWHVVHRPFSYAFAVFVLIHVIVALMFVSY